MTTLLSHLSHWFAALLVTSTVIDNRDSTLIILPTPPLDLSKVPEAKGEDQEPGRVTPRRPRRYSVMRV